MVIHSSLGASFPQNARRGCAGFPRGTRRRGPFGTQRVAAYGGFPFVRWIFEHIPNGLVIPVLLARPRPNPSLVQEATYLIDRTTFLPHPGIHLLHHAGFVKDDLKASFSSTLLLAHVAVAIGSMAENTNPALLCRMSLAEPPAFEKLCSLVFSNDSLHLQE